MKGIDHTCGSSSPDLSDGGSAVTVLRADGNANAPESGGDREPGRGVQKYDAFFLKIDIRFKACGMDQSTYPRDQRTCQPSMNFMGAGRELGEGPIPFFRSRPNFHRPETVIRHREGLYLIEQSVELRRWSGKRTEDHRPAAFLAWNSD